jgi:hypothetical protein
MDTIILDTIEEGVADKLSILNDVVHVQQSFTWDCGLACAKMVLR